MPEIKQVERAIRILQRLANDGQVTVNSLYEYFERKVRKRTLQRDLYEISAAQIPVVCEPGHGRENVWKINKGYLKFIPQTIGSQELLASFFLERLAMVARGTSLEKDTQSLLKKARALRDPSIFHSTDGTDFSHDMFGATFIGYIDYSDHSDTIDLLVKAASERRVCHFVYRRATAEKDSEFDAEPYLLLYHKGAMYAVVYVPSHDNYIFLPIQRIRKIQLLPDNFDRDPDFSMDKLREGRFGIFGGPDIEPERVVLRFRPDIAEVVAERVWHPSQELSHESDGSLVLTLETVVSDELRAWVGSWLDYVEVVKPKNLLGGR